MAKPNNPTNLKAVYNAVEDAVILTFVVPASSPATTSVRLQRWVDSTGLYSDLATIPVSPTTYVDSSVTDGRTYAYRALAINADGNPATFSTPSNKVKIVTTPESPDEVEAERTINDSVGVNWENNESVLRPLLYHYIYREDSVNKKLTQINRIAGHLQYYLDSRAPLDASMRYRVHSSNEAGGAYYMSPLSGIVYTTPLAPAGLVANWADNDIVLNWTNPSAIAIKFVVEHTTDNGASWFPVATLGKVTTWRHPSPERGVTHRYRVRSFSPKPTKGDEVGSGWTTSPLVPAQSTPNAPTILAPSSAPAGEAFDLTIRHNPVDGSPLGAAQLQHRVAGAGSWSATVAGLTVPAYASGAIEVRVATRTSTSAFGDWSAPYRITVRSRPTPTVSSPSHGQTVAGPFVPLRWSAAGQTAWEAVLVQGGNDISALSGGTEQESSFTVEDGKSYTIKLRVSDGYLWSNWVTRSITTAFSGPSSPVLTVLPDDENMNVTAHVEPVAGGVRYEVRRRPVGSTEAWTPVGDVDGNGYVLDPRPPLGIEVEYVAVAWNAAGGSTTSTAVVTRVARQVVAVNFGPGLGGVALIEVDIAPLQMPLKRERALHTFAGRSKPVEVLGAARTRSVQVTGRVVDELGSPASSWDAMLSANEKWFRDPAGASFKCSIESVSITREEKFMTVSFTAEEVA